MKDFTQQDLELTYEYTKIGWNIDEIKFNNLEAVDRLLNALYTDINLTVDDVVANGSVEDFTYEQLIVILQSIKEELSRI